MTLFICDTMPFLHIFLWLFYFIFFSACYGLYFQSWLIVCIIVSRTRQRANARATRKANGRLRAKVPYGFIIVWIIVSQTLCWSSNDIHLSDNGTECKVEVVLPAIICSAFRFLPWVLRTMPAWFRIVWRNATVYDGTWLCSWNLFLVTMHRDSPSHREG